MVLEDYVVPAISRAFLEMIHMMLQDDVVPATFYFSGDESTGC